MNKEIIPMNIVSISKIVEISFLCIPSKRYVPAIMNFIMISQSRLIHLLNASKRGEKNRLKNPVLCLFVFLSDLHIQSKILK